MLHPDYPELEGETHGTLSIDRTTFLVMYLSRNGSNWYIRSLSFNDLLFMYTVQLSIPSNSTLVLSLKLPDIPSMLYGTCPCYTSTTIVRYIAESLIPSVLDPHYSNIVRCYVNKSPPSISTWDQSYADDKGTDFIISRLKVDTS